MGGARKLRSDSFKGSKRHQQDRRALVCQPDKQGKIDHLGRVRIGDHEAVGGAVPSTQS